MQKHRLLVSLSLLVAPMAMADELLREDFETDLSRWRIVGDRASVVRVDSGDPAHGQVLELRANGVVYALFRGSEAWRGVRFEGEVLFPDDHDNYLGFIYNYAEERGRSDFGSVYIKGNGSYLRANPWRDGNASRLLYEEYRTRLTGQAAIEIGRWQRFRAEILGSDFHLYIGDTDIPQLTFDLFERSSGQLGLKPRIAGWPVWVDNLKVSRIETLTYSGPSRPQIDYRPHELLVDWEVLGPLSQPAHELERHGGRIESVRLDGQTHTWSTFPADRRGAVLTGRVTEYHGRRPVAYFRITVEEPAARTAVLHLTTADELALFVNGRFWGFVYRDGYVSGENDWNVWYDFWSNPAHAGRRIPIELQAGENLVVVRARNGHFAGGGFFARLEPPGP